MEEKVHQNISEVKPRKKISLFRILFSAICVGIIGSSFLVVPIYKLFSLLFSDKMPETLASEVPEITSTTSANFSVVWLFILIFLFWKVFKPLADYLGGKNNDLESAKKVFSRFFTLLFSLFFLDLFVGQILFPVIDLFAGSSQIELSEWGIIIAAQTIGAIYSMYISFIILENFYRDTAKILYTGEDLFQKRAGWFPSIHMRLMLMVFMLAVIPISLSMLFLYANIPDDINSMFATKLFWPVLGLLIFPMMCLIGYIEILYKSITSPLRSLQKKMTAVSNGDFNAKTSVLTSDELGNIKAYFNEMIEDLEERERLRDTFGKYVSIEIAKQLMKSGALSLGGEQLTATVLFSDIRNFTSMSEKMGPEEVINFLNQYFSYITPPIMKNHGVINKFIGDAVMAIFMPALGSENHAYDALKAAMEMREGIKTFNKENNLSTPVSFGVGIHTGTLVAGNVGTNQRLEYTVIGDTVNIASRIESETKKHSVDLLISEETLKAAKESSHSESSEQLEINSDRIDNVRVKGREAPLTLYKIL